MKRNHFLLTLGLALLVSLSACGLGGGSEAEQAQQATERFLTERNDGTPVVLGEGAGAQNRPVIGTVERIEGGTLMVKRPIDGTTATVQLDEGVKVRKQTDVQLSEVKAGDSITAFGAQQGTVFQAESLQIGGGPAGNGMILRSGGDGGAPAQGGQPFIIRRGPDGQQPGGGDGMGDSPIAPPLTGTVERIAGNTIVVKGSDSASTTVQLAEDARIHKQVDGQIADIQAGAFIMATGIYQGDALHAAQVEILPPPDTQ